VKGKKIDTALSLFPAQKTVKGGKYRQEEPESFFNLKIFPLNGRSQKKLVWMLTQLPEKKKLNCQEEAPRRDWYSGPVEMDPENSVVRIKK